MVGFRFELPLFPVCAALGKLAISLRFMTRVYLTLFLEDFREIHAYKMLRVSKHMVTKLYTKSYISYKKSSLFILWTLRQ